MAENTMVEQTILQELIRRLEIFFLKEKSYELTGETYDLMLFVRTAWPYQTAYNLLLSAQMLDRRSQRNIIHELLVDFRENVRPYGDFQLIAGLNIIRSDSDLVKNTKRQFLHRTSENQPIIEVQVGYGPNSDEEPLRPGLFVRSFILEKLKAGDEVVLRVKPQGIGGRIAKSQDIQIRVDHLTEDFVLWGTRLTQTEGLGAIGAGDAGSPISIPLSQIEQVWESTSLVGRNL